eukprot:6954946-Pyramimonas_sp.AAC.1
MARRWRGGCYIQSVLHAVELPAGEHGGGRERVEDQEDQREHPRHLPRHRRRPAQRCGRSRSRTAHCQLSSTDGSGSVLRTARSCREHRFACGGHQRGC